MRRAGRVERTRDRRRRRRATALKATSVRRSRVSLVRLDDVNDLVKYFTKHANGDVQGALSIAMEENAGGLRERLSELTQAAATSFAKAQASAAASDAQDAVTDDAGVDDDQTHTLRHRQFRASPAGRSTGRRSPSRV